MLLLFLLIDIWIFSRWTLFTLLFINNPWNRAHHRRLRYELCSFSKFVVVYWLFHSSFYLGRFFYVFWCSLFVCFFCSFLVSFACFSFKVYCSIKEGQSSRVTFYTQLDFLRLLQLFRSSLKSCPNIGIFFVSFRVLFYVPPADVFAHVMTVHKYL